MTQKKYDAIIIGAGIIGNSIAYELALKGYKTLSIDKLGGSGFGSTAGSCAIIRLYYSSPEGVALAREGYYYWLDWPKYLKTIDPDGMAYYKNTGSRSSNDSELQIPPNVRDQINNSNKPPE